MKLSDWPYLWWFIAWEVQILKRKRGEQDLMVPAYGSIRPVLFIPHSGTIVKKEFCRIWHRIQFLNFEWILYSLAWLICSRLQLKRTGVWGYVRWWIARQWRFGDRRTRSVCWGYKKSTTRWCRADNFPEIYTSKKSAQLKSGVRIGRCHTTVNLHVTDFQYNSSKGHFRCRSAITEIGRASCRERV